MMEELLEKYYKHFGENYPLNIWEYKSSQEIIERINYCIENNVKEKEPEYDENVDY